MPSMLTVAETGSLSVPLVSNHDVASPLRYPGGKSVLSGYVASLIDVLGIRDVTYVEPYAGGAGVALRLLKDYGIDLIWTCIASCRTWCIDCCIYYSWLGCRMAGSKKYYQRTDF